MALGTVAVATGSVLDHLVRTVIALLHEFAEDGGTARSDVTENLALLVRQHAAPASSRCVAKECRLFRPRNSRHACATHMLDAGTDLRTIQVLLGHRDIRTTARYLHVSLKRLHAASSPFDALQLSPMDGSRGDPRQQ
jgi:integrase